MSSFMNQAKTSANQKAKEGEQAVQECFEKGKEMSQNAKEGGEKLVHECFDAGKKMGEDALNQGSKAVQDTCAEVSGQLENKIPKAFKK